MDEKMMNKEKKKRRCRRKGPRGGLLRQTVPCAEASIAGRWLARVADGWNPWHGVLGLLGAMFQCGLPELLHVLLFAWYVWPVIGRYFS